MKYIAIIGIAIGIWVVFNLSVYRYNDCLRVGHAKQYCALDILK